jgi:SNF2 family DNA or RNA helicase
MALRALNRIAITGTPMRNKPSKYWGTLNWIRPDLFTSYWNWIGRYFEIESDSYSKHIIGDLKPGAAERMAADLAPFVLRRTKKEVLSELPDKLYAGTYLISDDKKSPHGIWLEASPKHRKQYDKFLEEGSLEFDDGTEIIANGQLAEYTRKLQLSGGCHALVNGVLTPTLDSPQFEWLVQKIDELGITDNDPDATKIVVASKFSRVLEVFAEGLRAKGIAVHLLTGKTTMPNRKRMVEDFQSDDSAARVFLLNTKAGGVAVTLDAADDLVILDETTIADDQEQVEDRIHRASRIHQVTIHYLRVLDTIAEEIAWITAAGFSVNGYILDGTRGVDYARKTYTEHAKQLASREEK